MTGETGSDRRCRLQVVWQSVPENGGCDRKQATAGCWQTVLRNVQLQRERRPQTATTWPRVDERDHETAKAVVGNVAT